MTVWLTTDEYQDVANSLQLVADQLPRAELENWRWKWIIVALFSALQGSCVCAATRTDDTGPFNSPIQTQIREHMYAEDADLSGDELAKLYDKRKLAVFKDLMKLVFPELNLSGEIDQSKNTIEKSVIRLWEMRNNFVHFQPGGWSIELSGMDAITLDIIGLIEDVIQKRHQHRANHFRETGAIELIQEIRKLCQARVEVD